MNLHLTSTNDILKTLVTNFEGLSPHSLCVPTWWKLIPVTIQKSNWARFSTVLVLSSKKTRYRSYWALQLIIQELGIKSMAIKAYQSFVRSYATHTKATKHIFHVLLRSRDSFGLAHVIRSKISILAIFRGPLPWKKPLQTLYIALIWGLCIDF